MTSWEYMEFHYATGNANYSLQRLNEFGRAGWEVVANLKQDAIGVRLLLKRDAWMAIDLRDLQEVKNGNP